MICPLVRVGCWRPPLVLCEVHCMLWVLVRFLLQIWVPLHLRHGCSELKVHFGGFFLWWVWGVPIFFDYFWLKIYFIECKLLQLFSWDLVKIFPPCTLRSCLSLSLRCVYQMEQNAGSCLIIQSVSLCIFIGELIPLMLRDSKNQWLLLPVIFVVRAGIMFVWLSFCGFVLRR